MSALTLFQTMPPTAQAAVIGSAVTLCGGIISALMALVGVTITNRAHDKRLREQFRKEDDRKRIEREMQLRKEIYFDVAETIHAGLLAISRCSDVAYTQADISKQLGEKRSALSKVHLVGGQEMVAAVQAISLEFGEALMHLTLARRPLLDKKSRIDSLKSQISKHQAEQERIVNLLKEMHLNGSANEQKVGQLQRVLEFEGAQVNKAAADLGIFQKNLTDEWFELVAETMSSTKKLNKLIVPVVKAARRELELPIDINAYDAAVDATFARQDELLQAYMANLRMSNG